MVERFPLRITGRYRIFSTLFAVMTLASMATRTALLLHGSPEPLTLAVVAWIFWEGFLSDLVTFSYFMVPFVMLMVLIPDWLYNSRISRMSKQVFFFVFIFALLSFGMWEYILFGSFSARPDTTTLTTLWQAPGGLTGLLENYRLLPAFAMLLLTAAISFIPVSRYLKGIFPVSTTFRGRLAGGALLLTLSLAVFVCSGTGTARISAGYAEEVAKNGIYNLFSTIKEFKMTRRENLAHPDR